MSRTTLTCTSGQAWRTDLVLVGSLELHSSGRSVVDHLGHPKADVVRVIP